MKTSIYQPLCKRGKKSWDRFSFDLPYAVSWSNAHSFTHQVFKECFVQGSEFGNEEYKTKWETEPIFKELMIDQSFAIRYNVSWSFLLFLFVCLRKCPSITNLLRVLIMKFSDLTAAIGMTIYIFLSLLIWWITLADFRKLNKSCIPGINSICSGCIIYFI